MAAFTGVSNVAPSISFGAASFFQPVGASGTTSVRTKIREALAFGIKNNITKSKGFFNDIGEVHVNAPVNDSSRKAFPSVDILWIRERYTNSFSGGNSLGGYNKFATILLRGVLSAEKCNAADPQDIVLLRETYIADIEKYFGINYFIPGETLPETAFNSIIVSNVVWGLESTEPRGGVDIELEISYRIELADPTQEF